MAIMNGLSDAEVQARHAQGLSNQVKISSSRTYGQIIKENVFTFVNVVLFGLGIVLILFGRVSDALISVGVITINLVVGIIQEIHAKRILDHIALITRPFATVVREGTQKKVDQEEIVVGDTLRVEAGDQIVVDGKLLSQEDVQVDESLITGEADPITKHTGDWLYSGSFCVSGSAYYQAEKVGADSLSYKMTASARAFRRVTTPLQKQVNLIVRVLLLVASFLEILLIVNMIFESIPIVEAVRRSVVVLGLVPNGLFLAISTAYALGAVRIARKGALVQQSNAIESLSHVNTLCMDKTGTLTTNHLKVKALLPIRISEQALRSELGDFAASLVSRNQTAIAIAEACPGTGRSVRESVPFSSNYRWSGLAFESAVYILGAPEAILPALKPSQDTYPSIEDWTRQGLRVLVFACGPSTAPLRNPNGDPHLPADLVPLGLIALADELRPETQTTIEDFRKAGVELKIISGDNPETVAALARQAGFDPQAQAVSGIELGQMAPEEMNQAVVRSSIFGRISPQQKEKIIQILHEQGRYVAMIGDGVNDVLAFKRADLAIAMQGGSQAARSVADIILLEDSFAVLPQVVREGQRILNGMQDIFKLFLTRILYTGLLILSTLAAGGFPLEPKNSSILTLLTVGIPTIALAAWAKPGMTQRVNPARRISHFVLPAGMTLGLLGLLIFIGFLLVPEILSGSNSLGSSLQLDPTGAHINLAQTALTCFSIFCGLFLILFTAPPTSLWVGGSELRGDQRPAILTMGLLFLYALILVIPAFYSFFELAPLAWYIYILLFGFSVLWALLIRWLWRTQALDRYLSIGS